MNRLLFVVIFVLFAGSARAEVLASLGTSVVFEPASNGRSLDQRQPWSVRGGYRFDRFDVYAEYSRFDVGTGTSLVGVTRKQEKALAWGRVTLLPWRLAPYVAAGAGVLSERVETRFGEDTRTDSGRPEPVVALAGGAATPLARWCELGLEGRLESSSAYAPGVVFGLGVFVSAKY